MPTYQNDPIVSRTNAETPEGFNFGVYGESTLFNGVRGVTYAPGHGAVVGVNENHTPQAGPGVFGQSDGTGVWGTSKTWMGVYGNSESTTGGAGVMGESTTGEGVRGVSHGAHGGVVGVNDWTGDGSPGSGGNGGWFESSQGEGVRGWSKNPNHGGVVGVNTGNGIAVYGTSDNSVGVWGTSINFEGVHAETKSPTTAAIAAYNLNPHGTGAAIFAKKEGTQGHAGFFEGNVLITGSLTVRGTNIDGLVGRIQAVEGLVGRMQALETRIAALESNQNTAVSNLTGRVTQAEVAISDLRAKVQQIIAALGGA